MSRVPCLYTHDLIRGRYSIMASTPDEGWTSVKNLVDGDPHSLYVPGSPTVTITIDLGVAHVTHAIAFANHNFEVNATITFKRWDAGSGWVTHDSWTVATRRDCLFDFVAACPAATKWQVVIDNGATDIRLGVMSLLTDYGYNECGSITYGENYGILLLSDGVVGLTWPIGIQAVSGIADVASPSGFSQSQKLGSGYVDFQITLDKTEIYEGGPLWKIIASFAPSGPEDAYTNPRWAKGAWLTLDEYDAVAGIVTARYGKGTPGLPMANNVTDPGGRAVTAFGFRTLSGGY